MVRERWYRYHLSRKVQSALNCTEGMVPVPSELFSLIITKGNSSDGTGTIYVPYSSGRPKLYGRECAGTISPVRSDFQ